MSNQEAGLACANWWADHVFGGTVASNGDGISTMLSIAAGVQGSPPPAAKRGAFVDALSRRIAEGLDRDAPYSKIPSVTAGVDYGPDTILSDSAREADLNCPNFPWKTNTLTYPTHVVASLGYGAPSRLVWHAEDWDRPKCNSGKYTDKGDRLPWKCSGLLYHEEPHTFDIPVVLCDAMVDRWSGEQERCSDPEEASVHHVDSDGWKSPRYHEFHASVETSTTH